jgi:hypothetical protein
MGLFSGGNRSSTSIANDLRSMNATGGEGSRNVSAGDGSIVSILDGGAIDAAFEAIAANDASVGASFASLLGATKDILNTSTSAARAAYNDATGVAANAYSQAQADLKGGFDQKTIMVLAALALGALVFIKRKG